MEILAILETWSFQGCISLSEQAALTKRRLSLLEAICQNADLIRRIDDRIRYLKNQQQEMMIDGNE